MTTPINDTSAEISNSSSVSKAYSLYAKFHEYIKDMIRQAIDFVISVIFSVYTRNTSDWNKLEVTFSLNLQLFEEDVDKAIQKNEVSEHDISIMNNKLIIGSYLKIDLNTSSLFVDLKRAKEKYGEKGLKALQSLVPTMYLKYTDKLFEKVRKEQSLI